MTLFKRKVEITDHIAGQPIQAPQLGMPAVQWRNGYGIPSDGQDTNSQNKPTRQLTKSAKAIIIYFSRSGSTELLAAKIAKITSADILEIVVKEPYSGKYQQTLSRANFERQTKSYPELKMSVPDLSQYDRVYLGFPIWAMTLAHPMTTFLLDYGSQLNHKQIISFMSEGGYGQGNSLQRIEQILRQQGVQATVDDQPLVIDGNKVDRANDQIERWLKRIN
ncbi:flavodoxin [Lactobacillus sp. 3B(2020)]|uniref:flavodoxin n=1 Tax=Lactobacillus sp. 3B(2020) TaxID=2695882 RepID=UPI0015DDD50D|nr:flavodoxin [Lactobacillus sp. 3B(2020)]